MLAHLHTCATLCASRIAHLHAEGGLHTHARSVRKEHVDMPEAAAEWSREMVPKAIVGWKAQVRAFLPHVTHTRTRAPASPLTPPPSLALTVCNSWSQCASS